MEGFLPIFFLMVVLKIPVAFLLYIVWWAFRAETQPDEAPPESEDHRFGPRRGDHGPGALPLPDCPPAGRARVFTPPAPVRASAARGSQRGSAEPVER